MINWRRNIELSKFDSALYSKSNVKFHKETPIHTKTITISFSMLAYYTAKAMLTGVSRYTPSTMGYARSYYQVIPYLLSEKAGYWALDNDNKNVLRDFSKTSRIGELAQGINYYICLKELGAFAVRDYKEFAREKLGKRAKLPGRLPDFVLCYKDKTYGVLESKGTSEADPTQALFDAKNQFENGKTILTSHLLPIKDAYASAISFATSSPRMKRNTKVFLVDPEDDIYRDEKMNYRAEVMKECSKHLCLAGNIELANNFRQGYFGTTANLSNTFGNQKNDLYPTGSFRIIDNHGDDIQFEMGFDYSLVKYLSEDVNELIEFKNYTEGNTDFFIDGTYMRIK